MRFSTPRGAGVIHADAFDQPWGREVMVARSFVPLQQTKKKKKQRKQLLIPDFEKLGFRLPVATRAIHTKSQNHVCTKGRKKKNKKSPVCIYTNDWLYTFVPFRPLFLPPNPISLLTQTPAQAS